MRKPILIILGLLGLAGCQKETSFQSAEDKLTEKRWYLEKKTIDQQAYSYNGVPTFSFELTKSNKGYRDSDGITGLYTITEQPSSITLSIQAGSRQIEAYNILLLEEEAQINFHWQNLEAIKILMDQSTLPHIQVKQAVAAIDSLQRDMQRVMSIDTLQTEGR
jgi:Prokaryotic membrane lipoprotein lipid attachment site